MKSYLLLATLLLWLTTICSAQFKNAQTETVKVSGNCGMCESTIEKSGSAKHKAVVDWDNNSKMATITYNPEKTSKDEILRRIAEAGYDNEAYLAPDEAYNNLSGCCQYDRTFKNRPPSVVYEMPLNSSTTAEQPGQHELHATMATATMTVTLASPLQPVYNAYFDLKDALVNSDGDRAATLGSSLLAALKAVDMNKLDNEEHMQWMKSRSALITDAEHISTLKDVEKQRDYFITLSSNMYLLMKTSKLETPVYFQHCPMANDGKGADWLSKENNIKNPYYGSMMLTCGKTVETLQ